MNLLFIGAGKMATALASGILKNEVFPRDSLLACDISPQARDNFTSATGIPCVETAEPKAVAKADVILLAVKPQVAEAAIRALPPRKDDVIVISICAGISIGKLRQWFGTGRVVRVMPNTPLMVGQGASCYALGTGSDETAASLAEKILGSLGKCWHVPESQLDAVTALSGSGPAYFFEFIEALRLGGEKLGLPADLALNLAIETMGGATEMLRRRMGTPEELRIAVTSKGGTTAAALDVMGKHNFRQMVEELLVAARDRSQELGRQ